MTAIFLLLLQMLLISDLCNCVSLVQFGRDSDGDVLRVYEDANNHDILYAFDSPCAVIHGTESSLCSLPDRRSEFLNTGFVILDSATSWKLAVDLSGVANRMPLSYIAGFDFYDDQQNVIGAKDTLFMYRLQDKREFTDAVVGFVESNFMKHLPLQVGSPPYIEKRDEVISQFLDNLNNEDTLRRQVRSKASQSIKQRIANNGKVRIAVGEVDYKDNASWLDTTIQVLDITCRGDYEKLFGNAAVVSAFKAEHVLEHLTLSEVLVGLRLMNQYLIPGGSLRIAVPTDLIGQCAYNGTSSDNTNAVETAVACKQAVVDKDESEKHKLQFTVASLSTILKTCGYNDITVVENVEENGQFFTTVEEGVDQTERGNIHRSMFESSTPKSIIIDAFKDKEAIVESDSRINAELSSVSNL